MTLRKDFNFFRLNEGTKKIPRPLRLGDFCGDSWTRTNDPIDVNDVLYRLSHATMLCIRGSDPLNKRISRFRGNKRNYTMGKEFGQDEFYFFDRKRKIGEKATN